MRSTTHRPVTWETLPWEPSHDAVPMSRSRRASIRRTYKAAIPPIISANSLTIDSSALAASDDARAEISRFDAELSGMLPGVEIAPLASILLRTESASSSQIENITTGARSLALAELGLAKLGSNAELVAANVEAMKQALSVADPITPEWMLRIHQALMARQEQANPGHFRTVQVWIGSSGVSPHSATFVPPHHSRVNAAIKDLCAFIARTDIPLMTQVAIAHAQFETIHPFNDGNGRVGRALVHAMLKHAGATTRATIPLSAGLLSDTPSYFDALTAYREGDATPIVLRFADAAFAATRNGRSLAGDLKEIYAQWTNRISARGNAAIWRVLPRLLSQPAVTSKTIQDMVQVSQPAADAIIQKLRDAGILTKAVGAQRNVVWIALEVTKALDACVERARRDR